MGLCERPNLPLIGVPECNEKIEAENTLQDYSGKFLQPSKTGQNSNPGNTENTTNILCKKSNSKVRNRQIHQG